VKLVEGAAPHVPYVFSHLWPRGVEELAGLGLTPEQASAMAVENCSLGPSWALIADNPVCVFGVVDGCSWFQSTDEFTANHVEITQMARDATAPYDFVIYSQCIHPRTEAWFGRLGFVRDDWQDVTVTGKPLYRFRRM
jgi:hypothetical protein